MTTKRAITVYVPGDSSAVAVGADEVAAALADYVGVSVVRTGSRGMLWLEPLVEVDTPAGRVGYPNVTPGVVAGLIHEGLLSGAEVGGSIGTVVLNGVAAGTAAAYLAAHPGTSAAAQTEAMVQGFAAAFWWAASTGARDRRVSRPRWRPCCSACVRCSRSRSRGSIVRT